MGLGAVEKDEGNDGKSLGRAASKSPRRRLPIRGHS